MGCVPLQYVLQYISIPRVGTKSRPAKPSLLRGKSAWGRIRHLEAPEMKLTDYGWTSDVTLFVTLFCLCLKNQGWVCGCLEDPYCASPKKQGWKTRRELVESWCGCCEPVGNRNGWNCISHKLAVTRFTASLQYQVSFCFSFRPGQLQMCLHIFNPHNITPALLPQLKQSCQIWVNYFS